MEAVNTYSPPSYPGFELESVVRARVRVTLPEPHLPAPPLLDDARDLPFHRTRLPCGQPLHTFSSLGKYRCRCFVAALAVTTQGSDGAGALFQARTTSRIHCHGTRSVL